MAVRYEVGSMAGGPWIQSAITPSEVQFDFANRCVARHPHYTMVRCLRDADHRGRAHVDIERRQW